jgi:hypothetical protein
MYYLIIYLKGFWLEKNANYIIFKRNTIYSTNINIYYTQPATDGIIRIVLDENDDKEYPFDTSNFTYVTGFDVLNSLFAKIIVENNSNLNNIELINGKPASLNFCFITHMVIYF